MKEQKRPMGRAGLVGTLSALLLASMGALASDNRTISGRVVDVVDGDTLMLLTSDDWLIQVQLANIEIPQPSSSYSSQAQQALSDLAMGKNVTLRVYGRDPVGRNVAEVFVGRHNVNLEMVRRGAAWESRQHLESALVRVDTQSLYPPPRSRDGDGDGFIRLDHRF